MEGGHQGMVMQRLAQRGFDLSAMEGSEASRGVARSCVLDGRRLLCGMVSFNAGLGFSFLRAQDSLTEDDTIPLPAEHPVAQTTQAAMLAVFGTLLSASQVLDHGVDEIERCLRLELQVVCTPGFKSLGHIQRVVASNLRDVLDQDGPIALATSGVAALPNGGIVAASAEYLLRPS